MTNTAPLLRSFDQWIRTYKSVGSKGKADLLIKARDLIVSGEHDDRVAVELLACAAVSEEQPEQRSIAGDMRYAAELLRSHEQSERGKN